LIQQHTFKASIESLEFGENSLKSPTFETSRSNWLCLRGSDLLNPMASWKGIKVAFFNSEKKKKKKKKKIRLLFFFKKNEEKNQFKYFDLCYHEDEYMQQRLKPENQYQNGLL